MIVYDKNDNRIIIEKSTVEIDDIEIEPFEPEKTISLDEPLALNKGIIENILPEATFLLEPFIAHSINILDGIGEVGKSILATQIALCISENVKLFNKFQATETVNVLYITQEETEYIFNDRLKKISKALNIKEINNFFWISTLSKNFDCSTYRLLSNETQIIKTDFFSRLLKTIEHYKIKFIVLDSLVNFYGLDENNTSHASVFIETLKMICKNYDCAFLLLHHHSKSSLSSKSEDRLFRGSTVFREQSRCRMMIYKHKDDKNTNIKTLEIEKLNYYTEHERTYKIVLEHDIDKLSFVTIDIDIIGESNEI